VNLGGIGPRGHHAASAATETLPEQDNPVMTRNSWVAILATCLRDSQTSAG